MRWLILPAFVLALAGGPVSATPAIEVSPAEAIEGDEVVVRVTGLAPGQVITLHAGRRWGRYPTGSEAFAGQARFTAGADGVVDTRRDAPLAGSSYGGADASGLFWSMTRVPDSASAAQASEDVTLNLESNGATVASRQVRLATAAPGVRVRDVREDGVVGVFAGHGPGSVRPAVILLGGSEGGLYTARSLAPILASRGYATLGLGYFQGDEPDLAALPPNLEEIPLEAIAAARRWLARQSGVDAERIAVIGMSKGAELALIAAATYPWIDAVAAFAPSHVVWEGIPQDPPVRPATSSWTLAGKPLPFVRWSVAAERRGTAARKANGRSRLTEPHLESLALYAADVPAATIPLEASRAAVMLVAGIDDGMWPSAYSVEQIQARLTSAGYDRPVEVEISPTGHQVLGTGWAPTTAFQRPTGRLQGGDAKLDAQAQAAGWRKLLTFLERHLR
ncbi:acyl-CoA thioester hydrolase/BAAT C-terminal domain-containing protein [Phenylobacterium sp.]|uniref:acyl-CoA thioester hydrolase/BAAT C-terminal domain-containing protein n=1 Tax=Phenylobacterium sp. TaxID=1871053 RepID=UPI00286A7274|nr:acyl-CoA thioester hydrolase/BAAT C-terminal domain-containing protein [Phenylobacterium sp.]